MIKLVIFLAILLALGTYDITKLARGGGREILPYILTAAAACLAAALVFLNPGGTSIIGAALKLLRVSE